MAKKYLDDNGMSYFWGKLKDYFQAKLVSGTNIKTINNESILGSGNIQVSAVIRDSNSNGYYCKLPDGTLIQWGVRPTYTGNQTFNLPTAMLNSSYVVMGSDSSGNRVNLTVAASTASSYAVYPSPATTAYILSWIAIGQWK